MNRRVPLCAFLCSFVRPSYRMVCLLAWCLSLVPMVGSAQGLSQATVGPEILPLGDEACTAVFCTYGGPHGAPGLYSPTLSGTGEPLLRSLVPVVAHSGQLLSGGGYFARGVWHTNVAATNGKANLPFFAAGMDFGAQPGLRVACRAFSCGGQVYCVTLQLSNTNQEQRTFQTGFLVQGTDTTRFLQSDKIPLLLRNSQEQYLALGLQGAATNTVVEHHPALSRGDGDGGSSHTRLLLATCTLPARGSLRLQLVLAAASSRSAAHTRCVRSLDIARERLLIVDAARYWRVWLAGARLPRLQDSRMQWFLQRQVCALKGSYCEGRVYAWKTQAGGTGLARTNTVSTMSGAALALVRYGLFPETRSVLGRLTRAYRTIPATALHWMEQDGPLATSQVRLASEYISLVQANFLRGRRFAGSLKLVRTVLERLAAACSKTGLLGSAPFGFTPAFLAGDNLAAVAAFRNGALLMEFARRRDLSRRYQAFSVRLERELESLRDGHFPIFMDRLQDSRDFPRPWWPPFLWNQPTTLPWHCTLRASETRIRDRFSRPGIPSPGSPDTREQGLPLLRFLGRFGSRIEFQRALGSVVSNWPAGGWPTNGERTKPVGDYDPRRAAALCLALQDAALFSRLLEAKPFSRLIVQETWETLAVLPRFHPVLKSYFSYRNAVAAAQELMQQQAAPVPDKIERLLSIVERLRTRVAHERLGDLVRDQALPRLAVLLTTCKERLLLQQGTELRIRSEPPFEGEGLVIRARLEQAPPALASNLRFQMQADKRLQVSSSSNGTGRAQGFALHMAEKPVQDQLYYWSLTAASRSKGVSYSWLRSGLLPRPYPLAVHLERTDGGHFQILLTNRGVRTITNLVVLPAEGLAVGAHRNRLSPGHGITVGLRAGGAAVPGRYPVVLSARYGKHHLGRSVQAYVLDKTLRITRWRRLPAGTNSAQNLPQGGWHALSGDRQGNPQLPTGSGASWLQGRIFLPEKDDGQALMVEIDTPWQREMVYWNGELIGSGWGRAGCRRYSVPGRVLRYGRENRILLRVYVDTENTVGGKGGIRLLVSQ